MSNLTIDDIIDNRLKTWFPALSDNAALIIERIRKDLASLSSGTRAAILAEIEALPRYEPELRKGNADEAAMTAVEKGQPGSFVAIQDLRGLLK